MIALAKLAKAARGGMDLESMLEMLSAMGVEMKLEPIPMEVAPATAELVAVAQAACAHGSKFFRMTAVLKGGQSLLAFLVLPNV